LRLRFSQALSKLESKKNENNQNKTIVKRKSRNYFYSSLPSRLALVGLFVVIALINPLKGRAANMTIASLGLGDSRPSATNVSYTFTASNVSLSTIRCIKEIYADTSGGVNPPAGSSTAAATFDTTNSNFMPTPAAWTLTRPANGTLQLTYATGEIPASAAARKLVFGAITNGSTPDTRYFLRVTTYSDAACTFPVDNATVNFIYTNGSTLSLTVDPTLSFTVNAVSAGQLCNGATSTQPSTATTIPFGTVTAAANSVVCQDLQISTNASNGYTVYARYTSKPTNVLSQTIADTSGTNAAPAAFPAPGTEAYGYTTSDAALGTGSPARFSSNLWAAMTTTTTEVAFDSTGVNSTIYRVGHQAGISLVTRPGTYVTTIIYTCTPVF
jgi:hypothetical protein